MWEKLTPADIERARHQLAVERGAMLSRHAAELKALEAEQHEIDTLERLANAFTEKYLTSSAGTEPLSAVVPATVPPGLEVEQNVSPNIGIRFRRLVGQ